MKKHLEFVKYSSIFTSKKFKDKHYDVFNNTKEHLGTIWYFTPWQCFVWAQDNDAIMSKSCLDELTAFMGELKK